MGKFDIGINLLRRTFSSASRREINLANNKELFLIMGRMAIILQ